jgi:hypothetical protein
LVLFKRRLKGLSQRAISTISLSLTSNRTKKQA